MRVAWMVLALVVVAGCVTPQGRQSGVAHVQDSQFDKQISITGYARSIANRDVIGRQMLRSWIDKASGRLTHQLYVQDTNVSQQRRQWFSASDEQANSLQVVRISSQVESCNQYGCTRREVVGVMLPDAFLRSNASRGFRIKLRARSGAEIIITVGADQIAEQLASIAAHHPQRPIAAPATIPAESPPAAASTPIEEDQDPVGTKPITE